MELDLESLDEPRFARAVGQVVEAVVKAAGPRSFHVVKIDNWFGPKWLSFSHKCMGAFGVSSLELVVPPFVPNRVVNELVFERDESGNTVAAALTHPLHVSQTSESNQARKMSRLLPDSAVFWWSGRSQENGKGSLMAYVPTDQGHMPWYAELAAPSWGARITKGITKAELRSYRSGASGTS